MQIWVTDRDFEDLRRLKEYIEYQVEIEFDDKEWVMSEPYYRKGKRRSKRIKRPTINYSYIYRKALKNYFLENENKIRAYEKKK